jgi:branched-chain amino acid transport system permease protein
MGMSILGAKVTLVQVARVITAALLTALVGVYLGTTRLGLAIRAVASDRSLATISGVPQNLVIMTAMGIGSFLAATAGVLVALSSDMTPTMGMNPLVLAVVAVIVSGTGRVSGLIGASLLLAATQQIVVWQFGAQWQDPVAFVLLLMVLLIRPQGAFTGSVTGTTL